MTAQDLHRQGLTRIDIDNLVRDGRIRPVRDATRVFVDAGVTDSWRVRLDIALAAAGPHAFAHRRSAAMLWAFDGCEARGPLDPRPEVAVPSGRHPRCRGVARVAIGSGDTCAVDGRRSTSPVRTMADLAAVLDDDGIESALECGLRRRLFTTTELRAVRGRTGVDALRRVLDRRPPGAPATESMAETLFVQMCRRRGLSDPVRQMTQLLGRRYRLDFAWPVLRVAVEIDGARVHDGGRLGEDLRRQSRLVAAGWTLLRFTWADLVGEPEAVMDLVGQALSDQALRQGHR